MQLDNFKQTPTVRSTELTKLPEFVASYAYTACIYLHLLLLQFYYSKRLF